MPEISDDLSTILDFVRWGTSRFNEAELYFGHGTDNAMDDALALVLHALHIEPGFPEAMQHARLTYEEKLNIIALFQRRIEERIPVPYLTQQAWFAGLPFYVNEHVLIPRSPLAELIEHGFSPWCDPNAVNHALDLCTGSGCIGIAMALALPHAEVDITDISDQALAVANENIARFELDDTVHAIKSDVFAGLSGHTYDLIVSNPPYVSEEEMQQLPAEYTREPAMALQAGDDGLDIVRRILQQAANHLNDKGVLIVEVGNSEASMHEVYPGLPLTWLEFERGGDGVFLITREQLLQYRPLLDTAAQ